MSLLDSCIVTLILAHSESFAAAELKSASLTTNTLSTVLFFAFSHSLIRTGWTIPHPILYLHY